MLNKMNTIQKDCDGKTLKVKYVQKKIHTKDYNNRRRDGYGIKRNVDIIYIGIGNYSSTSTSLLLLFAAVLGRVIVKEEKDETIVLEIIPISVCVQ